MPILGGASWQAGTLVAKERANREEMETGGSGFLVRKLATDDLR